MRVVIGALPDEARQVVRRVASERGAHLIEASRAPRSRSTMSDGLARMSIATPDASYGPVVLGLRGAHQVANALVAVRLLEATRQGGFALSAEAVVHGLAHPNWPARLELFELDDRRRVLLDAAHNVDGATALADYLRRWHPERPMLVLGVMHDKDVDAMLRALLPVVSAVTTTAAPTPRAMAPAELARQAIAVAAELQRSGHGGARPTTSTSATTRKRPCVERSNGRTWSASRAQSSWPERSGKASDSVLFCGEFLMQRVVSVACLMWLLSAVGVHAQPETPPATTPDPQSTPPRE